jgi:hypothetical protein
VAWSAGAEFSTGAPGKVKKKRKTKKNQVAVAAPVATGCGAIIESGPLVRLPISDPEFDKFWASKLAQS